MLVLAVERSINQSLVGVVALSILRSYETTISPSAAAYVAGKFSISAARSYVKFLLFPAFTVRTST